MSPPPQLVGHDGRKRVSRGLLSMHGPLLNLVHPTDRHGHVPERAYYMGGGFLRFCLAICIVFPVPVPRRHYDGSQKMMTSAHHSENYVIL